MAFGFPAFHTEHYVARFANPDLRRAARETLAALSWSLREETYDSIVGSTSINLLSWGEKVFITFLPGNAISVTSKCAMPTQCIDWGKNRSNVVKFLTEFSRRA